MSDQPRALSWTLFSLASTCVLLSRCTPAPVVNLPPAEPPIVETILDIDHNLLAPFGSPGVFQMQPGRRLELRVRAPWPTTLAVGIDGQTLARVSDTAAHPELDGYFRVSDPQPVSAADSRLFYRILVVLPQAKQGLVNYQLSVVDTSQDQNLTGSAKESFVSFTVFRQPNLTPQPSAILFQAGAAVPDQKHDRDGPNAALILDNISLAGWLVATPEAASDNNIEDVHYGIWLDNDFIERNYQATTAGLNTAVVPGRWYTWADNVIHPKQPIPLTGGQAPNAGTLLTVGPAADYMNVEMNAWHKSRHGNQAPGGWLANSDPAADDVFWPFDVKRPFNLPSDLQEGDYVILNGALVEDSGHLHEPEPHTDGYWRSQCWDDRYKSHGGWLEIHPVDAIRRVPPPQVRKQPNVVQVCDNGTGHTPSAVNLILSPEPSIPPTDYSQLRFRELVDDRFTDMTTVSQHVVELDPCDPTKLNVRVSLNSNGHFKAVYLEWWEEGQTKRPGPCVSRPGRTPVPREPSPCYRKPYLPQCNNPALQ